MKFRLVEENELDKRAKKHRKKQKGMSPFYSPDGGNVPLNISKFNNSVSEGANGLMEDTVKNSDGTWSNKGDEGSHGKFKTKKKADAQRKAMFANGYKESLIESKLPSQYNGSYGFVSLGTYKKIKKLSDKLTNLLNKYDEVIDSMESSAKTDEDRDALEVNQSYNTLIKTYQNNYETINMLSDMFKNNLIQVDKNAHDENILIDLDIYGVSDLQALYNNLQNILKSISLKKSSRLKDEFLGEDMNSNDIIKIYINSGISGDGFTIAVEDSNHNIIDKKSYHYGYNASYDKRFADSKAPYVTDIINDWCDKYNQNIQDVQIIPGTNTFKGDAVSSRSVDDFKNKYLSENYSDEDEDMYYDLLDDLIAYYSPRKNKLTKGQVYDEIMSEYMNDETLARDVVTNVFNESLKESMWDEKLYVVIYGPERNQEVLKPGNNKGTEIKKVRDKLDWFSGDADEVYNELKDFYNDEYYKDCICKISGKGWTVDLKDFLDTYENQRKNESLKEGLSNTKKAEIVLDYHELGDLEREDTEYAFQELYPEFIPDEESIMNNTAPLFGENMSEKQLANIYDLLADRYQTEVDIYGDDADLPYSAYLTFNLEKPTNKSLKEAWFTPLSEVSSFTGWMDDDAVINEEERFNSKLEKTFKTSRDNIYVLIDSDFEYDPRTYDIPELVELQEIKTKNIHAKKFIVNGIEFVFEDASSGSSPRLYFKSEEDGEKYTNYIDHYYDEEV